MLVFSIEQILLLMSSIEVAGENEKENGYKESCSSVDYYFSKKLCFVRKRLNKLEEENLERIFSCTIFRTRWQKSRKEYTSCIRLLCYSSIS